MVMGRALPGETGERFAVNSNLETPPPPSCLCPGGTPAKSEPRTFTRGLLGKRGEKEGTWAPAKWSCCYSPEAQTRPAFGLPPWLLGMGQPFNRLHASPMDPRCRVTG